MEARISDLIEQAGYAGIFPLMLLVTVLRPIQSEAIMPVAGLRAASGGLGRVLPTILRRHTIWHRPRRAP